MKRKEFIEQWNSIDKIKIFEIPVIDKRTGEQTYIIFDISIVGRSFIAQHEAMTAKQERSKKIATIHIVINSGYSIDQNLEWLHDSCLQAIIDSEFFELAE